MKKRKLSNPEKKGKSRSSNRELEGSGGAGRGTTRPTEEGHAAVVRWGKITKGSIENKSTKKNRQKKSTRETPSSGVLPKLKNDRTPTGESHQKNFKGAFNGKTRRNSFFGLQKKKKKKARSNKWQPSSI